MRVESESSQQPAAPPPWAQNLQADPNRPVDQQAWAQALTAVGQQSQPMDHHIPHDMHIQHHDQPYPIQVDPALNPPPPPSMGPNGEQMGDDQSPFTLQPAAYAASQPRQTRSRSGHGGSSNSSRARTDMLSPNAAALFRAATSQATGEEDEPSPSSPTSAANGNGVPRLPPILQVEKQTVTTTATQAASASRRRNEAMYQCPVPGCGSTFTRRFNLRGHLRSHTEERPYLCEWPGCGKGFARQHDCKRHFALHSPRPTSSHVCQGCGKSFSRTDALNRHLRSDNGADCRAMHATIMQQQQNHNPPPVPAMLLPGLDPNGLPGPHTKFNGHESVGTGSISPAGSRSPMAH